MVEAGAGWDGREPFPPQPTLLVDYLPPRYRTRYTPGFFRRLCVCLVLVAAKLADPDLHAELPGTLGEELALHALVGHARLSWAGQGCSPGPRLDAGVGAADARRSRG